MLFNDCCALLYLENEFAYIFLDAFIATSQFLFSHQFDHSSDGVWVNLSRRFKASFEQGDIVSVTADTELGILAWHVNGKFVVAGKVKFADSEMQQYHFGCAMVHSGSYATIIPKGPPLEDIPHDITLDLD